MKLFNKLPGFVRSPPGLERIVLRHLLPAAAWGTLALALALLAVAVRERPGALSRGEILLMGLLPLYWSALLCAGIAAFIVMVMKGPAYVADAYPLPDMERQEQGEGRRPQRQLRAAGNRVRRRRPAAAARGMPFAERWRIAQTAKGQACTQVQKPAAKPVRTASAAPPRHASTSASTGKSS